MNTLLIYPEFPDGFFTAREVLDFFHKKATHPPLGLLTVASLLPEAWEKRLVDCNVRPLSDDDIRWADMVFVSAMYVQWKQAQALIHRCKALQKTVAAGGPVFSNMPEAFEGVDHCFIGEGEATIPRFLDDLRRGEPQHIYIAEEKPDLALSPIPLWSLIDKDDYLQFTIQHARGCPFNCEFCDVVVLNGRVPRTKSLEQILRELDALYDRGVRGSILFSDDNFIGNKAAIKPLLISIGKWMKDHRYPFIFHTQTSINLADDEEIMTLMAEANFTHVFIGIETPHTVSLKECGKFHNTKRDLLADVRKIQHHGLNVDAGFIVGFDSDTEAVSDMQIDFIQKSGITFAMVGMLGAVPKTRLWYRLEGEGRLCGTASGDTTDGSTNIVPKMGLASLQNCFLKIISTIYDPPAYYQRIHTMVDHLRPRSKTPMGIAGVRMLWRMTWKIGILSKDRFHYWKVLLRTFVKNRPALPAALECTIFGTHFERYTDQVQSRFHDGQRLDCLLRKSASPTTEMMREALSNIPSSDSGGHGS